MIKLKNLLTESISREQEREIVQSLYDAEKVIKQSLPQSDTLWDAKLKWETAEENFRGHIEKRPMGVNRWNYVMSVLLVSPSNKIANAYARAFLSDGNIVYKANVYSSSGVGNTFNDSEKMNKWLKDQIINFKWSGDD